MTQVGIQLVRRCVSSLRKFSKKYQTRRRESRCLRRGRPNSDRGTEANPLSTKHKRSKVRAASNFVPGWRKNGPKFSRQIRSRQSTDDRHGSRALIYSSRTESNSLQASYRPRSARKRNSPGPRESPAARGHRLVTGWSRGGHGVVTGWGKPEVPRKQP